MNETRLLLVELVREDPYRNYRAETYPIIKGVAADNGIPVEWIVIGLTAGETPTNPFVVDLVADDEEVVRRCIGAFRASHVLLNEKLTAATESRLASATAGVRTRNLSEAPPGEEEDARPLLKWLGVPDRYPLATGSYLEVLEHVTPDYSRTPANEPATRYRRFIKVLCGRPCFYRRPLTDNPAFAGVDLGPGGTGACSFCNQPDEASVPRTNRPVMDLVLRQIASAARSLADRENPLQFILTGSVPFLRIDEFFAGVEMAGVPPAAFFFSCRVDEFMPRARTIRSLLPQLKRLGHSFNIHNIGVENFSAAENARLNKGVTADQVVEAFDEIVRLEQEFPETFAFHKHGGFSYILFTPWTTPEDLRVNVTYARRVEVPADSFFFQSRLQLLPGRPIVKLAERDGLISSSLDDAAYDSGCISCWDQREIPWRFQHPEVRVLYSIISRWGTRRDGDDHEDPLYKRIQTLRAELPGPRHDTYEICDLLLELASAPPGPGSTDEALARLGSILAAAPRREAETFARVTAPPDSDEHASPGSMRARIEWVLSNAKHEGLCETSLLEGSPSLVAPGTVQIALANAASASASGPAAIIAAHWRREGWQGYNLAVSMMPAGGTPELRLLARLLASQLLDLTRETGFLKAEWHSLLGRDRTLQDLLERAVFPSDGRRTLFAGFAPYWPVVLPTDRTLLTLRSGDSWIDLYVEERGRSTRCYVATGMCSVSYFPHTPLDTAEKRRAVAVLVNHLEELESRKPPF